MSSEKPTREELVTGKVLEFDLDKEGTVRVEWRMAEDNSEKKFVIGLHGAFRNTGERKFKEASDAFNKHEGVDTVLIDMPGNGLSKELGNKFALTVEKWRKILTQVLDRFAHDHRREPAGFLTHSLGGLAALQYKDYEGSSLPMVGLSTPLQKSKLIALWLIQNEVKKDLRRLKQHRLTRTEIQKLLACNLNEHINEISGVTIKNLRDEYPNMPEYVMESARADYVDTARRHEKSLLNIYGENDVICPPRLLKDTSVYNNLFILPGADHDLERDEDIAIWLPQALDFIRRHNLSNKSV